MSLNRLRMDASCAGETCRRRGQPDLCELRAQPAETGRRRNEFTSYESYKEIWGENSC